MGKYSVIIEERCYTFALMYGDDIMWFWIKKNRKKIDLKTNILEVYNYFVNINGVWVRKNIKQFENAIKKFVKKQQLDYIEHISKKITL